MYVSIIIKCFNYSLPSAHNNKKKKNFLTTKF